MTVSFHPIVWQWFSARFGAPTPAQERGWPRIAAGEPTLIAAPTGSGKTLAAFLWSIDRLIQRAASGTLEDKISVVYVSPLKALGNDIEKNLREPLSGILEAARLQGIELPEIRAAVRSGDTLARERRLMLRRPPHILITTPESLYILLTAEKSRQMLREAETVIVDEIHALAGDKRGSHLSLSLERLDDLAGHRLQRIGLSATQKPIEEIARWLVGTESILPDGAPGCAIVDLGHRRPLSLSLEVPERDLGPITSHEIWDEIYGRVVAQVHAHRTTLVFVNTRRLVERVSHRLTALLGEGKVGAHHGSLSRKSRLEVEQGLKSGELAVVVATASMELGIDIGQVDLVCNIGSPRALATLLQRVGRSGHGLGAMPKGVLYPLTRDELIECTAATRALRAGELDRVIIPEKPLDVLAQQIVATVASSTGRPADNEEPSSSGKDAGMAEEDLRRLIRRAYPYRHLTEREFEQLVEILSEGVATRRGRRSAYLHRDLVHGRLRPRRGARLTAITNGGAIPDAADYDVLALPDEIFVGKVNEDFAIETLAGDIFLLGNRSWRIRRVFSGKVWVEDAQGLPPTIPFWLGEAPGRTPEFSLAVSDLRRDVADRLGDGRAAVQWLVEETGLPIAAAEQIVAYVRETLGLLGCVPTADCIVAERFFDEAGGMQLVLHAPFGGRINRAWGMALRKRFCVGFDREIQAAATDDGIVLSLGEQHSFPLNDFFSWLRPPVVEKELVQAVLDSPMFTNRWRWSANRALAVLRFSGGKKVPMFIQRIRAEELLGQVFPGQVMCQDNRTGPVELPDHPLVNEVIHDCLHEAMDIDGLEQILQRIERRDVRTIQVDTPAPSPMAHEILNANPYAFLDDAPLEERRSRAVSLRRLDPELARGIGALDPEAVKQVCEEARPRVRDADELHDFLLDVGLLPVTEAEKWAPFADELIRAGRAAVASWPLAGGRSGYVAAERRHWLRAIFPESVSPDLFFPSLRGEMPAMTREDAVRRVVLGWIHVTGPVTAAEVASKIGFSQEQTTQAFLALEAEGVLLRGEFRSERGGTELEWCERGLLSRIHRLTVGRLRREIEPVTAAEFMRFLLRWQHVEAVGQLRGREGVAEVIGQLQGLEIPAPAWEQHILPSRIEAYDPEDLEDLCLGGIVAWGRLKVGAGLQPEEAGAMQERARSAAGRKRIKRRWAPTRVAPMGLVLREDLPYFIEPLAVSWRELEMLSHPAREAADYLERAGASFLSEIAQATGLLKGQTEEALWELVAHGLVTGDGIAGLRVLLTPEIKRRRKRRFRVISGGCTAERLMPVGRWSLWRNRGPGAGNREKVEEFLARQLLRRYGLVFPELLARETRALSWRTLAQIYRRLENRGEIRGGRFVSGFIGEQFALPEAVELLRVSRRAPAETEAVVLSASDPLNLVGIILPGQRVSPYSNQAIAYLNGVPVDVGPLGAVLSRLQRASL